jgi:putative proteasome-type protease
MRCGLLSIDSTMRSNATVGPPLECLFYRNDSLDGFQHYIKLEENHPYLTRIRQTWDESIRSAFKQLPSLTEVFEAD